MTFEASSRPRVVPATYRAQAHAVYVGNPVIEALEVLSPETLRSTMRRRNPPRPTDAVRALPASDRIEAIDVDLSRVIVPLPRHADLYDSLIRALRKGLVGRNPLPALYWLQDIDAPPATEPATNGMVLTGHTGVGKTTGIKWLLGVIPQVIQHRGYRSPDVDGPQVPEFIFDQITYLHVSVPHNGLVRGLVINLLEQIGWLIGQRDFYLKLYNRGNRASVEELVRGLRHAARAHGVGLIILDEVQQLTSLRGKTDSEILNLLFGLEDQVGVPFILVGMEDARNILAEERTGRRATSQGDFEWQPLQGAEWDIFFRGLWAYQYTAVPTAQTAELSRALHLASAGIPDYAVKAFAHAQMHVIREAAGRRDRNERLTPDLFEAVLKHDMKGTWQNIQTLKAAGPTISIDQRMPTPDNDPPSAPQEKDQPEPDTRQVLVGASDLPPTATPPTHDDAGRLGGDAVPPAASDGEPSTKRRRPPPQTRKTPPKNDLAAAVAEGKAHGLDAHAALVQKGIMGNVTDLLAES